MWESKAEVNVHRLVLKEARIKKPKTSDQVVKYAVREAVGEFVAAVAAANHCVNILIKSNQSGWTC